MKKTKSMASNKRQDIIFMASMLVWPVAVFLIFYVFTNFNMIIMAFEKYDENTGKYVWDSINNFKKFFNDIIKEESLSYAWKNSMIVYGLGLIIGSPIAIIIANSIYKKYIGAGFFRIILFLPSIISSMVWVMMYRYFIDFACPAIFGDVAAGWLSDPSKEFTTVVVYAFWISFAGNMVLYTGAMARIPTELVEYGRLDGLKGLKELWYLTVPLIFPTITVFLVTGIASIFTNNLNLYSFFGSSASTQTYTFGYYFFIQVFGNKSSPSQYPYASAAGLCFTLVVAPLTIIAKSLLEKYGPNSEY